MTHKQSLRAFLARNPFAKPLTLGFFYREKMRAIHRVAPSGSMSRILEIGGGQSGLTALLYPQSTVVNLELDRSYARAPANLRPRVRFVSGDATALPFETSTFDAVTLFDVVEHVPDDASVVKEALRVLRGGGALLISTPALGWRFPYYSWMRRLCPSEAQMMQEWGHVRRGYALEALESMVGWQCQTSASFIGPLTVVCHDVSFSKLPALLRRGVCALLSPLTWSAYLCHRPNSPGTEFAAVWVKPG